MEARNGTNKRPIFARKRVSVPRSTVRNGSDKYTINSGSADDSVSMQVPNGVIQNGNLRILPKSAVVERDISGGKEFHKVPVVNAVDDELPTPFTYLTVRNISANLRDQVKKATEKSKLCCTRETCPDKCRFDTCPCRLQAGKGNTYEAGRLLFRKMLTYDNSAMIIRECGASCICQHKSSRFHCGNRVMAKKANVQVELVKTADRGWGVLTKKALREGQYIGEYTGIIRDESSQDGDYVHSLGLMLDDGRDCSVNAAEKGNFTRFLNHSCLPNAFVAKIVTDSWHPGLPHLCLFTICDIPAGAELLIDYGPDYWKAKQEDGIWCRCGESICQFSALPEQEENSEDDVGGR